MTKSKPKMPKGKTPEELYREYQRLRDDIPAPAYTSLKAAAENATHEDNIEVILQRAKTFHANQSKTEDSSNSSSFFTRLKRQVLGESSNRSPAWGAAFASLALAAIAIPFALNLVSENSRDAQLAYFDDCADCLSYIQNAAVSTRSTTLGLISMEPKQRYEARLGLIFADLKILQSNSNSAQQQDVDAQVKRLRALPSNLLGPKLTLTLSKSNLGNHSYQRLIAAIQSDQSHAPLSPVFLAAQNIEIANITARRAQDSGGREEVTSSFLKALEYFELAAQSPSLKENTLAQNTLSALNEINKANSNESDQAQLKTLIELYTRALQSLGV